jgi:hypothetical protein
MVPLLTSDMRRLLEAVEARARADERARILLKRLFLSETELVELTGYQRSKNQIRWRLKRAFALLPASVIADLALKLLQGVSTIASRFRSGLLDPMECA